MKSGQTPLPLDHWEEISKMGFVFALANMDMSVRLIKILNWSLLVIVLIGIPTISSVHVGSLRLTALSVSQLLTLWALGLAAGVNGVASIWLAKGGKVRRAFRAWVFIHAALFGFCWLVLAGHVHFDWLKEFFLWLRKNFQSIQ